MLNIILTYGKCSCKRPSIQMALPTKINMLYIPFNISVGFKNIRTSRHA